MRESINKICATHKALFKRDNKTVNPIFDTGLTIMCRNCADFDLCSHNARLKEAHLTLRRSMREYQAGNQDTLRLMNDRDTYNSEKCPENSRAAREVIHLMDDLIGPLSEHFKKVIEIGRTDSYTATEASSEPKGPPPTEERIYCAEFLDSDLESVGTHLTNTAGEIERHQESCQPKMAI
jgi:hypothetical protein